MAGNKVDIAAGSDHISSNLSNKNRGKNTNNKNKYML